jgi:hypothetical protein
MNERIQELAVEAGVTGYFAAGTEYATPIPLSGEMAKFAELIVKECIKICSDVEADTEMDLSDGALVCMAEIKEHFGVEQ